jgi:pyrimidine operon attenuation protein / uracil phosphoribosyltransferase
MEEKIKARIMDATKIRRVMNRIATEVIERNRALRNLVIVGIPTRGIFLGKRIAQLVKDLEGVDIPVGVLDITLYRDDRAPAKSVPASGKTKIDVPINKKDVILVDDVLFTGRTVRAAMDFLFDRGRPRSIQLLVLIDRGHRELPIRANYTGKFLPTSRRELIQVHLKEIDKSDNVLISEPAGRTAIRRRTKP